MKIKDFLDLGGNPLHNFCIGTYTDLENANRGTGRTLFYTGNDVDRKDHVIVFDGSTFKALAYVDDVANNEEFKALQDDVKLLKGDVDTDAIISNMKEVSAFLAGFAEDAKLMDVLNGKLDKKGGTIEGPTGTYTPLFVKTTDSESWIGFTDKVGTYYIGTRQGVPSVYKEGVGHHAILTSAGGTIDGSLRLNVGALYLISGGKEYAYNVNTNNGEPIYLKNNAWNTILHSGNIKDYKAGGLEAFKVTDVNDAASGKLFYGKDASNMPATSYVAGFTFPQGDLGYKFQLAFDFNGNLYSRKYGGSWQSWQTLIHSGNIGEYKAGGIINLGSPTEADFGAYVNKYDGVTLVTNMSGSAVGDIGAGDWALNFGSTKNRYGRFIATLSDTSDELYWQSGNSAKNAWGSKRKVAFTDSTVAAANKLVTDYNTTYAEFTDSTVYIGRETYSVSNTVILGNAINLRHGGGTNGLILNSSGNVTIGASDYTQGVYKLYVDGTIYSNGNIYGKTANLNRIELTDSAPYIDFHYGNSTSDYTSRIMETVEGRLALNELLYVNKGGNVLIGTTSDDNSGAKLQVNGNISGKTLYGTAIELSNTTPFIDFHFNKSTSDHTSRIIEDAEGRLLLNNLFFVKYGSHAGVGALDSNYKFYVGGTFGVNGNATINGDLHVTGNIIADKEVSAGGASEEGGSSSGGGGNMVAQTLTKGRDSYSVSHNLDTKDVIVCIYEKDGNSDRWDMILTDIEITDKDNITVTFGSVTTVDHRVVIMGAVA